MMQRTLDREDAKIDRAPVRTAGPIAGAGAPRSCYGVQVLIAGRRKQWRDEVGGQIRRAGYSAISVDSAVDALTVLVLGLPVDVLVTDAELHGSLGLSELAAEARALRPTLGIVVACDSAVRDCADLVPADALLVSRPCEEEAVASSVREMLAARAVS
ncbi:histidine kinase [Methylobacterium sp. R2-1]|uniref:histidine kinase n=1 Tax=Methylobacterium sp. R2-1 TaxID=2587064 RepID=UPI001616BFBD|nr:histidine kinase [Methylobacterium sp. R2-1]MBB2961509.1 DNA-binding NtrC family response regulator [Methylobacterium sp. R2-1]